VDTLGNPEDIELGGVTLDEFTESRVLGREDSCDVGRSEMEAFIEGLAEGDVDGTSIKDCWFNKLGFFEGHGVEAEDGIELGRMVIDGFSES